ncbi:MAG: SUF system Fe-S cluster assembly protein [Candidatus Binatia bacterium]
MESSTQEDRAAGQVATPQTGEAASAVATSPSAAPNPDAGAAAPAVDLARLEHLVIDALHSVYDPEIPVDIYELGLIYSVDISPDGKVAITMTLTTPACPVAGSMPGEVERVVRMVEGVTDVVVDLVWEPTWGPAMMTEAARLQLNMY